MSIAEKLQTIAENQQRVYNKGYQDGKDYTPTDYMDYASSITFSNLNLFAEPVIEINLEYVNTFFNLFRAYARNVTVEHIIVNCKNQITNMQNFYNATNIYMDDTLKKITLNVDTSKATSFMNAFFYNRALEIIDGKPIDCSACTSATAFNSAFSYDSALTEIRFVKNSIKVNISFGSSSLLSLESIQSIIDGLADLTGQTAQTLTVHSVVYQKIIDNGWDALITAKNWTLAKQ